MAALLQKEKVFLFGVKVKILGSFHSFIIARGIENVQQESYHFHLWEQLISPLVQLI